MSVIKSAIAAAIGIVVIAGSYFAGAMVEHNNSATPEGTIVLSECQTEDSTNCYWDAARSNGIGRSFVDIAGVQYFDGYVTTPNGKVWVWAGTLANGTEVK